MMMMMMVMTNVTNKNMKQWLLPVPYQSSKPIDLSCLPSSIDGKAPQLWFFQSDDSVDSENSGNQTRLGSIGLGKFMEILLVVRMARIAKHACIIMQNDQMHDNFTDVTCVEGQS